MMTLANADFVYAPVIFNLQPFETDKKRNSGALNLSVPYLRRCVGGGGGGGGGSVIIKNHKN